MVGHLLKDVVWRNRRMYFSICPFVTACWAMVGSGVSTPNWGVGIGLGVVVMLGPLVSMTTAGPREVRILPVIGRDIWVTAWLMSTVVAAIVCGASAALGIFIRSLVSSHGVAGAASVPLFTLYAFVYGGLALVLVATVLTPMMAWLTRPELGESWAWPVTIAAVTLISALLILPYVLSSTIPATMDEFDASSFGVLAVSLLVVFGSLVRTPGHGDRLGMRSSATAQPRHEKRTAGRFADRFTGLSRIAFSQVATVIGSLVWLVVLELGFNRLILDDTRAWSELLQSVGHPLIGAVPTESPGFLVGMLMVFAIQSPWSGHIRHLKVLPISSAQLTMLLVVTPVVTLSVFWLLLILLNLSVTGTIPEPRALVWAALASLTALAHSVSFHEHGSFFARPLVFGLVAGAGVGGLVVARASESAWVTPLLGVLSVSMMAFAVVLTYRTVTRSTSSSKAYQQPQLPVGIGTPVSR